MKKALLLGIAAFAFGGLTSCSNILEDSGVNPAAKAKTGELGIALEADASVSVTTKAGASDEVTLSDEEKKKFVITGTKAGGSSHIIFRPFKSRLVKVQLARHRAISSRYRISTYFNCFNGSIHKICECT